MVRKQIQRRLLLIAGILSTLLGIVGIFVPLLPTTPLLLLAAACFMRSSERFYNKLVNHKILGVYIKNYIEKKGIPIKVKLFSLGMLWAGILSTVIFATDVLWLRILLITIALVVSIHIALIRKRN